MNFFCMHIHEYRRVSFIHCLIPKGLAYDQTKFIGKWSLKTGNFYMGNSIPNHPEK